MKILAWDCETAPAVVHSFGLFNQNHGINQVVQNPYMMSFAAQWEGQKKVIFKSVHHDSKDEMLKELHSLLDEADAVISWNGKGFDSKWANKEFLEAGMLPPSPYREIDLMLAARSRFRFLSNKLDFVAQLLGVGAKKVTGGHELWVGCMNGDPVAWAKMRSYNKKDVTLLWDIYAKLLPWIPNVGRALHDGLSEGCVNCSSQNLHKRGFHMTTIGRYQRYQCLDCGKWQRGKSNLLVTDMRPA